MSNFFSNLFSGTKSKSKKEKSKETNHDNHLTEDGQEAENLPVLNRRLSLSKSGRMKEKKRSNISVMQTNLDGSCKETNNRKPSLVNNEVFDIEGIERAEKEASHQQLH
ncbi:hypothetical protein D910_04521 [Dendroctonus ponderosae]